MATEERNSTQLFMHVHERDFIIMCLQARRTADVCSLSQGAFQRAFSVTVAALY